MPTVLITGGSGMVGRELSRHLLANGYEVIWLSRRPGEEELNGKKIRIAAWDPLQGKIDNSAIEQADHIINLAGAGVADERWTIKRKQEIIDSRVKSGQLIIQALNNVSHRVQTLINASAIGWYGPDTEVSIAKGGFVESDPYYPGFLGDTCKAWEESVDGADALGIRLVKCRIGIVLARNGGAIEEFGKPVRIGVAAIMGSGQQTVSWIHVEDLCRLFLYAIQNTSIAGIYNAVSPGPVSNKELVTTLAGTSRKHFLSIKIPAWALKLALGEMSIEVLKSATVNSRKIQDAGFSFNYPTIGSAMQHLIS